VDSTYFGPTSAGLLLRLARPPPIAGRHPLTPHHSVICCLSFAIGFWSFNRQLAVGSISGRKRRSSLYCAQKLKEIQSTLLERLQKEGELDVLDTLVGAPALLEALAVPGLRLWVSVAGHAGDVLGVRLHRRHVFRAVVWLLLVATAS
jgi:hypothetical protein